MASLEQIRKTASAKMISAIAAAATALIGSIGTGVYVLEDRYLTATTGITKDAFEEKAVTKADLMAAQEATSNYLLELRIEQAEQRQMRLLDEQDRRGLTNREEKQLRDLDLELQRLYDKQEQRR